jgi:hypothetical protein
LSTNQNNPEKQDQHRLRTRVLRLTVVLVTLQIVLITLQIVSPIWTTNSKALGEVLCNTLKIPSTSLCPSALNATPDAVIAPMPTLPPSLEDCDRVHNTPACLYKVRDGDTLSGIARKIYGDEAFWPVICRANLVYLQWYYSYKLSATQRQYVKSLADFLEPNWILVIPKLSPADMGQEPFITLQHELDTRCKEPASV